jgi:hypothetical protein
LVALGVVDDAEDLVIESAKPHSEVICGHSWRGEAGTPADALGERESCCVEHILE